MHRVRFTISFNQTNIAHYLLTLLNLNCTKTLFIYYI